MNHLISQHEYLVFPFTLDNLSVHSLGKWHAKFRTAKFSPGIAFTIFTDQFKLPKNNRKSLKLVSNMVLTNRTWICSWNILSGKNMTSFSDVSFLPEILHRNGRKNRVTITFRLDFPQNFGKQLTTSTPRFQQTKLQSPPDNSNLQGKSKKVWVIRSSSYWGLKENSRE